MYGEGVRCCCGTLRRRQKQKREQTQMSEEERQNAGGEQTGGRCDRGHPLNLTEVESCTDRMRSITHTAISDWQYGAPKGTAQKIFLSRGVQDMGNIGLGQWLFGVLFCGTCGRKDCVFRAQTAPRRRGGCPFADHTTTSSESGRVQRLQSGPAASDETQP